MKRLIYFGFLLIILVASSCGKGPELPTYSSVKGFIKSGLNQSPMEGLKVRLIDMDAPIDTVTLQNDHLFLDSTTTCARGFWKFDKLDPGKYAVVVDDLSYGFTLVNDNDSLIFSLPESTHLQIDMEAAPKLQSGWFDIKLDIYNIPDHIEEISVNTVRYAFVCYIIPDPEFLGHGYGVKNDGTVNASFHFQHGFSSLSYSLTNLVAFDIKGWDPLHTGLLYDFIIGDLVNAQPSLRRYSVDYNTMSPVLEEETPYK